MELIERFLDNFEVKKPENIVKLSNRYFLDENNLLGFCKENNIKPYSVGRFLGEDNNKMFVPSVGILDLIKDTKKRITVNKKGEWLFSCGRDLFKENIIGFFNSNMKEIVGVENEYKELIGIGILEEDFKMKNRKVIVKNILDVGSFLRREKKN